MRLMLSKVTAPYLPETVVDRPSVVSPDSGGAVFSGPAGFGKTTYALLELRRAVEPVAWLSLQYERPDPENFSRLLLGALTEAQPKFGLTGLESEPELIAAPDQLAENLIAYAGELDLETTWICFDGFEAVQGHSSIVKALQCFYRHGASCFRIIVTTWDDAVLEIADLEARGLVRVVRQRELSFSRDEVAKVVSRVAPSAPELVTDAWDFAKGWPVATAMWARQTDVTRGELREDPTESFARFVDAVLLKNIEPGLQQFLFRTCFFEILDEACSSGVGFTEEESRFYISQLAPSGLPILQQQANEVRVHVAVRDAVKRSFRSTTDPSHYDQTVTQAARYFEDNGELEAAMDLLVNENLFDEMLETIKRKPHPMLTLNHRFEEWFGKVPDSKRSNPLFIRVMATHLMRSGRTEEALTLLRRGMNTVEEPEDQLAIWIVSQEALSDLHLIEDPAEVEKEGEAWKKILPQHSWNIDWIVGFIYSLDLQLDRAMNFMAQAAKPEYEMHDENALQIRGRVLSWRAMRGERVEDAMKEMMNGLPESISNPVRVVMVRFFVEHFLASGRVREARRMLESVEAAGPYIWENLHHTLMMGTCLWKLGETVDGFRLLESLQPKLEELNEMEELGGLLNLEHFHLQNGNPSVARRSRIDQICAQRKRLPAELDLVTRALLAYGNEARSELKLETGQHLLSVATKRKLLPWRVTGGFLTSWGLDKLGRRDEADDALRTALDDLATCGWLSYPMAFKALTAYVFVRSVTIGYRVETAKGLVNGDEFVPLLEEFRLQFQDCFQAQFASGTFSPAEVATWIDAARDAGMRGLLTLIPKDPSLEQIREEYAEWAAQCPLPSLEIQVLGGFEVRSKDGPRTLRRSASKKLFQYLLISRGAFVNEERMMDLCWPDAEISSARRSLQTTMNELRNDLDPQLVPRGNSYIAYDDGAYSLVLPESSTVDLYQFYDVVGEFLSHAETSEQLPTDTTVTDDDVNAVRGILEASARGLLPGASYDDFVVRETDRVDSMRKAAALRVARSLHHLDRSTDATVFLEHMLSLDPLWEEGVEGLFVTLRAQGRVAAAIRAYRGYEQRLADELDLLPGKKLSALLMSLRS